MDAVIVVLIFVVLLSLIFLVARPGFRRGRPGSSAMVDASPAHKAEADDGGDDDGDDGDGGGDA
jgi:hypothetical protein